MDVNNLDLWKLGLGKALWQNLWLPRKRWLMLRGFEEQ